MSNTQTYIAELLGTLVVVFVGTAAIITTGGNPLLAALAFGLTWAGMWWVFGNVSGGHFNPAITIAAVISKRMDSKDAVPYIVCQAIGAIIASALLWFVLNGAPAFAGNVFASTLANVTMTGWSMTSVIVFEVLMTAFFALMWLAITEKTNAPGITGLALGFTYAGILVASLGTTWSALNPVRTLGPALLANGGFATIWVFWLAPIVGAIVGAGIWIAVVQPARSSTPSRYSAEA